MKKKEENKHSHHRQALSQSKLQGVGNSRIWVVSRQGCDAIFNALYFRKVRVHALSSELVKNAGAFLYFMLFEIIFMCQYEFCHVC